MRRPFFACLLAVLAGCSAPADAPATSSDLQPDGRPGRAQSVADGDSLRIVLDGVSTEIRLLGINAPEDGECWSEEARQALEAATTDRRLVVEGSARDDFGRLLAYVHDGPTNVNIALVRDGHAIATSFDHELRADMLAAESEAIDLERGLWSRGACGDEIDHSVTIWALEPDAPGRDDANPNGEWVAITNGGPSIALTGWVIRDESSTHRYAFPPGFALDEGEIVVVRSGCGADTDDELFWCAETPVWNNAGDTALLLEPSGAIADRRRHPQG